MKIQSGLFDHIVLQRDRKNVSHARTEGICTSVGAVFARVTRGGKAVPGIAHAQIGSAGRGRFDALLAGLPVGGSYEVTLQIGDGKSGLAGGESLTVHDVLVGDVWLLGGQSNMCGVGRLAGLPQTSPMVRAFYMGDRWGRAKDPIHNLWDCVDQVHKDLCGGSCPKSPPWQGAGPGVSFGQRMYELSGVPQGLIPCAHGGTIMPQWDASLKRLGTRSLYGALMRRVRKNGGRVAGMVWDQGQSDADHVNAPQYTRRTKKLVADLRRDCGNPRLPWVMVQAGLSLGWGEEAAWNSIQEQQRRLGETMRHLAVVPCIDTTVEDGVHIDGPSQWRMGRRLADAMWTLLKGEGAQPPPIAFRGFKIGQSRESFWGRVVLTYDNVVGRLRSDGKPRGFEVTDSSGGRFVCRVDLDGNRVIVGTRLNLRGLPSKQLHYGLGCFPACNITDSTGRSLPVMGPISLGVKPTAVTDFIRSVRVSDVLPCRSPFRSLRRPNVRKLKLRKRQFWTTFLDMHNELAAAGLRDAVVYYELRFRCQEPMKLVASLGYDGPIKAWVDGRELCCDLQAGTPAVPDVCRAAFAARAGDHELVVALSSNKGTAWGIFVRLARLDLPPRVFAQGPAFYAMPQVIE